MKRSVKFNEITWQNIDAISREIMKTYKMKYKLKDKVITIKNYERYWDESTPKGHQIRIAKTDGSKLIINLEWPKGHNPRKKPTNRLEQMESLEYDPVAGC
jgi:hypothetical protein